MKTTAALTLFTFALVYSPTTQAHVVTFGGGANQFTMEFVPIGNPGNPADATGNPNPAGSVSYEFGLGKFEVSRDVIAKANAPVASGGGNLGVTLQDMTSFGGNGVDRPAIVSWNEAARFINWLNTSQSYAPAYKFTTQVGDGGYNANENISLWVSGDAGYNPANPFRNALAHYALPDVDEWYKAAYYDPAGGVYYDYPTGSNIAPTPVTSGTTSGTAVYSQGTFQGPADVMLAGGLSPYGTMGQGGNAYEWNETESDLVNDSVSSNRVIRAGRWSDSAIGLNATNYGSVHPTVEVIIGFRVVQGIPEPSSGLLGAMSAIGLLARRRRKS